MNKALKFGILLPALGLMMLSSGCTLLAPADAYKANQSIKSFDANRWDSTVSVLRAAESAGNLEAVLATGQDFLVRHPNHVEARVFVARALTRTGDPEQALRTLNFILPERQTDACRLEAARAKLAMNDTLGAKKTLDRLVKAHPLPEDGTAPDTFTMNVHKLAAVQDAANGDWDKAERAFAQLLGIANDKEIRYNWARVKLFTNDPEGAWRLLEPLVANHENVRPMAAVALYRAGHKARARALLKDRIEPAVLDKWLIEQSQTISKAAP